MEITCGHSREICYTMIRVYFIGSKQGYIGVLEVTTSSSHLEPLYLVSLCVHFRLKLSKF